jgi:hypothetical protein
LAVLVLVSGCRDRVADLAHRQCMTDCEDRNRACILHATSSYAVEQCSQEVSSCIAYCPR